ncbi:MAG: endonuclease [Clostridia bacterium]|nr:endonuclease [Clostridia bacterium]
MKKAAMVLLVVFLVIVLAAAGLVGWLSAMEYKPDDIEILQVTGVQSDRKVRKGEMIGVVTMNVGYGGLGAEQDFFMDGGTMTRPQSKTIVEENTRGVLSGLNLRKADIYLLQEVDRDSYRSYWLDQGETFRRGLGYNMAFAYNYNCEFVPFPWPPLGKVKSGLATYTRFEVIEATRESLPVPFAWPVRAANLKRCLLVERIPVEGTEQELVIVNLHLEAYDDGEGKIAQTKQLMQLLKAEYAKGNYVIAGGDFNQVFEDAKDTYPLLNAEYWQPGELRNSDLPSGFRYAYDDSVPTCRLLNAPYTGERSQTQMYVIDGFIVSDNVHVNLVETVDLNFAHSDHQPVFLQVTLK